MLFQRNKPFCVSSCRFISLHIIASAIVATSVATQLRPRVAQAEACPVILRPQPPLSTTSRIVGGRPSGDELASSMAYLINSENSYFTGILVAPTIVLSFVHPFDTNGRVFVGGRNNQSGTLINISSVVLHPSYKPNTVETNFYSLMYVVLASPAPSTARPVKVFTDPAYPKAASYVRHVGYGSLESIESTPVIRRVLHQVDVPVYNADECAKQYSSYIDAQSAKDVVYCAGYKNRNCSVW